MSSNERHPHGAWETDREQLVSQALTTPKMPLIIIGPDILYSLQFAHGIVQDLRVRQHFAGRCIVISCHGGHASDTLLQGLATQLSLKFPDNISS